MPRARHKAGVVERPGWCGPAERSDKHFAITTIRPLDADHFFAGLNFVCRGLPPDQRKLTPQYSNGLVYWKLNRSKAIPNVARSWLAEASGRRTVAAVSRFGSEVICVPLY
jgi:hypothetical protein